MSLLRALYIYYLRVLPLEVNSRDKTRPRVSATSHTLHKLFKASQMLFCRSLPRKLGDSASPFSDKCDDKARSVRTERIPQPKSPRYKDQYKRLPRHTPQAKTRRSKRQPACRTPWPPKEAGRSLRTMKDTQTPKRQRKVQANRSHQHAPSGLHLSGRLSRPN